MPARGSEGRTIRGLSASPTCARACYLWLNDTAARWAVLRPASKRYASPRARLSSARGRRIKDGPVTGDGCNGATCDRRAARLRDRCFWNEATLAEAPWGDGLAPKAVTLGCAKRQ